ncbi:hypothetical protein C6376_39100 [Streptomyces sp. P3]|nr:hypothetical protein C6376_38800 [Streptomyces sp. P3]AVV46482.1 hypothetical protein C6376_39100 [Streptomyces sp. P3]
MSFGAHLDRRVGIHIGRQAGLRRPVQTLLTKRFNTVEHGAYCGLDSVLPGGPAFDGAQPEPDRCRDP